MAEDLTEYLHEAGLRVRYMHSDVETLERIELIRDLRLGVYDVLVGINLLREGLDIPECGLVAILDADKEGFLRSETSLIQTIGRAARNVDGRVILYADRVTGSDGARAQRNRPPPREAGRLQRRARHHPGVDQEPHQRHHERRVACATACWSRPATTSARTSSATTSRAYIGDLEQRMRKAAADLEFEEAGRLRDEIRRLEEDDLGLPVQETTRLAPGRQFERRQAGDAEGPLRQAEQDQVGAVAQVFGQFSAIVQTQFQLVLPSKGWTRNQPGARDGD